MRVTIDDDFFMDMDERNYVLKENITTKKKDGTFVDGERTEGYFTDFGWALKRVIEIKLQRKEEVTDVRGFLNEFTTTADYVYDRMQSPKIHIDKPKKK